MSPNFMFWLALPIKMAITAALVVVASLAAEAFGPLIGAMVATLPIAAGPAYVFLAMDHGAPFIAASALSSLVVNAANVVFCAVYTLVAQRHRLIASLGAAIGAWMAIAVLAKLVTWTVVGATLFNIVVVMICLAIVRPFRGRAMPVTVRRWYEMPFRALMVASLVAMVVAVSARVGPTVTGILALYPIVLTSLALLFHIRIGGPATATITANAIPGLAGYAAALIALNRAAIPAGTPVALMFALTVSVGWNLAIIGLRRTTAPRGAA